MLISAGVLGFVILGMFFAMLSQSPKSEAEVTVADTRDNLTR